MKLLSLVSYTIFPARTGGQKGIALFNKYLSRQCDMICVTVKSNDPGYADHYQVLNILGNSAFRYINPLTVFTLRSIIRRHGITHLVLEHPYFGWLGLLLKKITGVRLVVHSHNIESTRWKGQGKWWWPVLQRYEKMTHRHSDYNLFIQEADLHYAVETFGLVPRRCITATYGLEWQAPPTGEVRSIARERIRRLHGVADDEHLLFFNGAFNYAPNLNALLALAEHVVPLLNRKAGFRYKILICGINIPPDISARDWPNILVVGFVENIQDYFMAADVFLNPVIEGGGIKTKLVDALGYNCNVVSSRNGAIGVAPEWCNDKLLVTGNYDWQAFADAIPRAAALQSDIPAAFFDRFYWGNIVGRVAAFLQEDYRNL